MSVTDAPTRPGACAGPVNEARPVSAWINMSYDFIVAVGTAFAVAGNRADDEPRTAPPQLLEIEARARHSARHQVLHKHVGPRDQPRQEIPVVRVFDVENDGFLAAVEPYEITALAFGGTVVAVREIPLGPLDLDHLVPASARRQVHSGAATACSTDTTSIPSSGRPIFSSKIARKMRRLRLRYFLPYSVHEGKTSRYYRASSCHSPRSGSTAAAARDRRPEGAGADPLRRLGIQRAVHRFFSRVEPTQPENRDWRTWYSPAQTRRTGDWWWFPIA